MVRCQELFIIYWHRLIVNKLKSNNFSVYHKYHSKQIFSHTREYLFGHHCTSNAWLSQKYFNRRRNKQKPVLRKETSLHWESSGYLLCLAIRRWKDILRPFKKRKTNCLLYWYIYVRLQPLPNSRNTLDARTTLVMNSCGENMKYFTTWIRLQLWIINLVCRKVYRLAKGVRDRERVVCCKTLKLLYLVVMKGNQSLHKIQGEIVAAWAKPHLRDFLTQFISY